MTPKALDREPLFVALASRLAAMPGLASPECERRLKPAANVPPEMQPAVFLVCGDNVPEHQTNRPSKWKVSAGVVLYVRTTDPRESPATVLNGWAKKLEEALAATDEERMVGPFGKLDIVHTTLGGKVSHCWLKALELYEGVDSGQGTLIAEVELFAVAS